MVRKVSVLGAFSLLGQHLLRRLTVDPGFEIVGLHDQRVADSSGAPPATAPWFVGDAVRDQLADVPCFEPMAEAAGELVLSFLPDSTAEEIEAAHLARGARILTHCEYARLRAPLVAPGFWSAAGAKSALLATANCTTAMCSLPLALLHETHGVSAVHITTLQAISGTDLPGMHAHQIHDQVVADLPGEARALRLELAKLFGDAFAITCAATRVPVWRGHTVIMMLRLDDGARAAAVTRTLEDVDGLRLCAETAGFAERRALFDSPEMLCEIGAIRDGSDGWVTLCLKGDNLEAVTTGVMHTAARFI